ncbi:hypothetical protein [Roseateles sp. P5_E7]
MNTPAQVIETHSASSPAVVPSGAPRTMQEAIMEARYGCTFHLMNERLYERTDFTIGVATLAGGSAAIAAALKNRPEFLVVAACVFGSLSIASRLWGAGRKAERHLFARKAYSQLLEDAPSKTLAEVDKAIAKLERDSPGGFSGLAQPAYNAVVIGQSYPQYAEPLSAWERTLNIMV